MNAVAAAVIALLIWAYANDRTRESASVAGTVRLAPADPRVQFVEPSTAVSLAVEVRGSRRAIEAFEDVLRSGLPLATGGDGLPAEAGTHAASFREVLAANPTVIATGAEVVRVRPESLRFEVGSLVTEQVPIAVVLPNAAVRGEIFADPQVVTVTLPEAARKSIGALSVDAAIDTKNLEAGKPQQIDVELRLPSTLDRWKELCRVVPPGHASPSNCWLRATNTPPPDRCAYHAVSADCQPLGRHRCTRLGIHDWRGPDWPARCHRLDHHGCVYARRSH